MHGLLCHISMKRTLMKSGVSEEPPLHFTHCSAFHFLQIVDHQGWVVGNVFPQSLTVILTSIRCVKLEKPAAFRVWFSALTIEL